MFEWTHCTSMSFAVDKWQRANKSKIEKPRYTIFINGWLRSIEEIIEKFNIEFSLLSIEIKKNNGQICHLDNHCQETFTVFNTMLDAEKFIEFLESLYIIYSLNN